MAPSDEQCMVSGATWLAETLQDGTKSSAAWRKVAGRQGNISLDEGHILKHNETPKITSAF